MIWRLYNSKGESFVQCAWDKCKCSKWKISPTISVWLKWHIIEYWKQLRDANQSAIINESETVEIASFILDLNWIKVIKFTPLRTISELKIFFSMNYLDYFYIPESVKSIFSSQNLWKAAFVHCINRNRCAIVFEYTWLFSYFHEWMQRNKPLDLQFNRPRVNRSSISRKINKPLYLVSPNESNQNKDE